jgi:hypothetical protein
MTKSKQGPRAKLVKMTKELENRFERWSIVITSGANDPCWSDGVNANLVRNHIIVGKRRIIKLCSENDLSLPEIINRPTPEVIPDSFMAKPDEIRTAAQKYLSILENNVDYLYLVEMEDYLSSHIKAETLFNVYINHVRGLRIDIEEDNLVEMQRIGDPERYRVAFDVCATRVRELTKNLNLQKQVKIPESENEPLAKPLPLPSSVEQVTKPHLTTQLDFSFFY